MAVGELSATAVGGVSASVSAKRWWQLLIGIVCMSMIANLQYGWTLFVNPIHDKFNWTKAEIQIAFTIFVVTETWLVPIEGYLVDRFGPRPVTLVGGLLVGISWVLNSYADSLTMLYVSAAIGGTGAGAVYGTCVGNALKWFPDRRGLAAGLTAMGFGAGSALTVIPIATMIKAQGYEATFLKFGIVQGAVVFLLAWFLSQPGPGYSVPTTQQKAQWASRRDYTPKQMITTPVFWVMYLMFVMMAAGGLMATAQLAPIAKDFKIADVPVSLIGITLPALTFALSIDRVLNGVTRPFFGWVSDKLGRENTMFIAFFIEGVGIIALSHYGQSPVAFVILTGMVFFAWGEIYSLFPATCGDTYGSRYAAANAGLLYTAKGTAALLVPLTSVLAARGGWGAVFITASVLNLVAAFLALAVLKPMRRRMQEAGVKIAVVGAGAIGGYLGAKLALAGEDVTFIARNRNLAAIQADGFRLILEDGSEQHAATARAVQRMAEAGEQDVVLLTLKAHQVRDVLPELRALFGARTAVVTMINGLPWWYFHKLAGPFEGRRLESVDPDGALAAQIEPERIIGSVVYPATELVAPGIVRVLEGNRFTLGELDGSRSERIEALSKTFMRAGFKSPVARDIRSEIWIKLWGNLSLNPISALSHATLQDICRFPLTRTLVERMMTEGQAVAEKLGVVFKVSLAQRIAGAEAIGAHKTSMLQDVEHGRALELEALVGSVVELGRITDTPTPNIDAVYAVTRLLGQTLASQNGRLAVRPV